MYTVLVVVQVFVAVSLVGLILVQHGKGADAGAAFGAGASGTVFGSRGSANFLSRATAALATVFFVVSLSLAYLVNDAKTELSVVEQAAQDEQASGAVIPEAAEPAVDETPSIPEQ